MISNKMECITLPSFRYDVNKYDCLLFNAYDCLHSDTIVYFLMLETMQ